METTEMDSQFLEQDFLLGEDIKISSSHDENFDDFTKDVISKLLSLSFWILQISQHTYKKFEI
jgi:hypothetical protein